MEETEKKQLVTLSLTKQQAYDLVAALDSRLDDCGHIDRIRESVEDLLDQLERGLPDEKDWDEK